MERPNLLIKERKFDEYHRNEYEKSIIYFRNQLRILSMQHDETMREHESLLLKCYVEIKIEIEQPLNRQIDQSILPRQIRSKGVTIYKPDKFNGMKNDKERRQQIVEELKLLDKQYETLEQSQQESFKRIKQIKTEIDHKKAELERLNRRSNYEKELEWMEMNMKQKERMRMERIRFEPTLTSQYDRTRIEQERQQQAFERLQRQQLERQQELERQRQQQLRIQRTRPN